MKILVINAGSSSLKYQLIDMQNEQVIAKGLAERIGIEGSNLRHRPDGRDDVLIEQPMKDHIEAMRLVLDALTDPNHGVIDSMDAINAVGHRVLHCGERYKDSVLIDDEAIQSGASGDDIANLPLPESTRAAHVLRSEAGMWEGVESADKDPRKSLHIGDIPLPEIAPDEAVIAVMASSINFNTVWTSIFEPLPTFGFLDRLGKESVWGKRHDLPYHIVGSDS